MENIESKDKLSEFISNVLYIWTYARIFTVALPLVTPAGNTPDVYLQRNR